MIGGDDPLKALGGLGRCIRKTARRWTPIGRERNQFAGLRAFRVSNGNGIAGKELKDNRTTRRNGVTLKIRVGPPQARLAWMGTPRDDLSGHCRDSLAT